jgi:hypothetical protein
VKEIPLSAVVKISSPSIASRAGLSKKPSRPSTESSGFAQCIPVQGSVVKMPKCFCTLGVLLFLVHSALAACPGTNVVTVCTDDALREAVAIGGTVRLCCNGVLTLTNTIDVTKDTTLDASGQNLTISGGHLVRLFTVANGISLTITNITLAEGRVLVTNLNAGAGDPALGGAIRNDGGIVRLVDCVVSNNWVQTGGGLPAGAALGGAIYNQAGTVQILHSRFVGNSVTGAISEFTNYPEPPKGMDALARGAAIFSSNGVVVIGNSVFVGNTAYGHAAPYPGPQLAEGGAIWATGLLTVSNSDFSANTALSEPGVYGSLTANLAGGAICFGLGDGIIFNTRFSSNSLRGGYNPSFFGSRASGGALFNSGNLQIQQCSFSGNQVLSGAGFYWDYARGGAICNAGLLSVEAVSIFGNRAAGGSTGGGDGYGQGGGVWNGGTLYMTNSTLADNRAEGYPNHVGEPNFGGGLYNYVYGAWLVNVTFASNNAVNANIGGPIGRNIANYDGSVYLLNSLLAAPGENVAGAITDEGYNMSSDDSAAFSSGSSFNFTDPKLLPLADNSGPTLTMALAANSPAIDWAPAAGAPATDQRGVARPGLGANVIDLGAYEWVPAPPALVAALNGGSLNVSFAGSSGETYRLERCTSFSAWELHELIGPLPTNGPVTRTIPAVLPGQFFRLRWGP